MEIVRCFPIYGILYPGKKNNLLLKLHSTGTEIPITSDLFSEQEFTLAEQVNLKEGIVGIIENNNLDYFIHVRNNSLYVTPYLNNHSEKSIDFKIEFSHDRFYSEKTKYSYNIVDSVNETIYPVDKTSFKLGIKKVFEDSNEIFDKTYIYAKLSYGHFTSFLEYTIKSASFSIKTLRLDLYNDQDKFKIKFYSFNNFSITMNGDEKRLMRSKIIQDAHIPLPESFSSVIEKPILFKINNKIYLVTLDDNGKPYIAWDHHNRLFFKETTFKIKKADNGLILYGKMIKKHDIPQVDTLITNRGQILGNLEWKNDSHFSVLIPNEKLMSLLNIHNHLFLAVGSTVLYPVQRYTSSKSNKGIETTKSLNGLAYVAQRNKKNRYTISVVVDSPIYNNKNLNKIKLATIIAKITKPFIRRNVNLYFEKETSKANESGKYVFEEVKKTPNIKSKNYFILDENSSDYEYMKETWGKSLVRKYSFKHYLLILLSDNFISSELSSHVLGVRVYSDVLNRKALKTPLYFLQHGIMFAKPVDNPTALGFHKKNQINNVKKSVISSDLEATEFYKMGYDDSELMKTGLPKLDGAYLDDDADKISFMPTWRFWEESYIIKNEIEKTTYFKSLMEVINLFEQENMLDKLLIVPHNKFSQYIADNMTEYRDIICTDPADALRVSKIFITDYSSIIYDATARGAFPIFYWKDSEYLIEKYQAIPPVNTENAPGKIAWNEKELVDIVKQVIINDYQIPDEIMKKYKQINEFDDRNNSKRVVKELIQDKVI